MLTPARVATAYLMIPGRVAVSVALNRSTPETVTISDAWSKEPSPNELGFAGVDLGATNAKWCIPDALLNPSDNGREIRPGDEITDPDSHVWQVLTARAVSLRSRWECVCARTTLG